MITNLKDRKVVRETFALIYLIKNAVPNITMKFSTYHVSIKNSNITALLLRTQLLKKSWKNNSK